MDEGKVKELKEETIRLLRSHGYKPRVVPHGSVRQLRGGLTCIDLEEGGNIDSAVLMARGNVAHRRGLLGGDVTGEGSAGVRSDLLGIVRQDRMHFRSVRSGCEVYAVRLNGLVDGKTIAGQPVPLGMAYSPHRKQEVIFQRYPRCQSADT